MDKEQAIADILKNWRKIPEDQHYELDLLKPGDAPGVAQLFYTIYGDKYPVDDYYIPERIARLNAEGKVVSVVARLANGEVAGQGAFYQSSPPNKALYEFGQMLVAPEYRNTFVAFKIAQQMLKTSHNMPQAEGFFGEAVCNHTITQKLCDKHGYSECGLEVALMPSGAYEKEGAGARRVSCMLGARVDRDSRRSLYLPECYRKEMDFILSGFTLDRDIRFEQAGKLGPGETVLETERFDFAQVARCHVLSAGEDFLQRLREVDAEARRTGLAVVQAFVNMEEPGAVFAVNALREQGFFFGGFLPIWFKGDGLLMQKLFVEPEFEAILLHADRSKVILDFIREDYARAKGAMHG